MRRGLAFRVLYVALATGSALLASEQPCQAFVRTYTALGCNPVHWAQTCVYVTTDSTPWADMALPDRERIAQEAIGGWEAPADAFLELLYLPASGPREVGMDGYQVIKVRSDTWCRPADATGDAPTCYDPSATALTTLTFVSAPGDPVHDGVIVDADIELNAVNFAFYDADSAAGPPAGPRLAMDMWNVLAHELGHVQGLDHPCRSGNWDMPACTRDSSGNPVIQCSAVVAGRATQPALESIFEDTMYPSTVPKETSKRDPKADDLTGVADTYPPASDPRICQLPGAGVDAGADAATTSGATTAAGTQTAKAGCNAGGQGSTPAGAWPLLAVAGVLMGARRARRRKTSR